MHAARHKKIGQSVRTYFFGLSDLESPRLVGFLPYIWSKLRFGPHAVRIHPAARAVGGQDSLRRRILGLVLRGALLQLAVGLAIGIPAALAGGRLLANQLYGVKSYDPAILALAGAVLTACALVAGFVPAQRAASIDPIRALRVE